MAATKRRTRSGLDFDQIIAGDDAVAVEVEPDIGIGERKNLLGRRGLREQRLADEELPDAVGAPGGQHPGQGIGGGHEPRHLAPVDLCRLGVGVEQFGYGAERGVGDLLAFEILGAGDAGTP